MIKFIFLVDLTRKTVDNEDELINVTEDYPSRSFLLVTRKQSLALRGISRTIRYVPLSSILGAESVNKEDDIEVLVYDDPSGREFYVVTNYTLEEIRRTLQ